MTTKAVPSTRTPKAVASYVLPAFEAQGKGWGWKPSGAQATTEKRQMELPLENDVARFPDAP